MALQKTLDKRQGILIVLVLLIVLGFLLTNQPGSKKPIEERRAAFQCEDGSSFTAIFMSNDELTVMRAGAATIVATKQALDRTQYDTETYSYLFEGATAIAANKETRTIVRCTQVAL